MKPNDYRFSLIFLLLAAPACGGRIAAEDGFDVGSPPRRPSPIDFPAAAAPTAPSGKSPSLAAYCDGLTTSKCGEPQCVSDEVCRTSYANASEVYRRGVVACRRTGGIGCGYPDPCVVEQVTRAPATDAQRALANAYCRACSPDADIGQCRDAALRHEGGGESLSVALRVLGDTNAERALECETNLAHDPQSCEGAFINCLAKYRPIVSYDRCR